MALTLAVGLVGCNAESGQRGRVLLIGIDGASPRVTTPMLAEGKLPNLGRIAREGISGPLRSFRPLYSPRIWNSIATGKTPKKHGIESFVRKDESGAKHLYQSHDRKVHALWNIVSDHGLKVGVVNWWNTYPPEKVNGAIVSDHFFPEYIAGLRRTFKDASIPTGTPVFPESFYAKSDELLRRDRPITEIEDPFQDNHELPKWVKRSILSLQFRTDDAVARTALAVESDFHPDLLMVFLPGIDRVSHWLWGNLEPEELYPQGLRPTPRERAAGVSALRRYYQYTDALIGALVDRFGPQDLVMVVSDHGFEARVTLAFLTGNHESSKAQEGVIFARGRGIPASDRPGLVTVNDVTPTILTWLGLPVASDMDGRPAVFLKEPALEKIATYDTTPIERLTTEPSGVEGEIVDHLRGLGYVE